MFFKFMRKYQKPADDGDTGAAGGTVDRGDDFESDEDDTPAKKDTKAKTEPSADAAEVERMAAEAKVKADAKDDVDETDEEETETETDEQKAAKAKARKDTRVPLARHEALLTREREARAAAEAEVARLKQGQVVADTNEKLTEAEDKLLSLEKEYTKLLADGEHEKAATKMGEIRKLERGIIETKATFETQAAEARAYERVQYDNTVSRLEEAYPVLNPDHADYDKDKVAEVVELRDGFVATGKYTRAQAIQKAAKALMGVETTRQTAAVETTAKVKTEDVAKKVEEDRKAAARKKAADASTKQPADTKKVGLDSDAMGGGLSAKAVMGMSQDEFAKLDEKVLARMRGDEVEA